MVNTKPGPDLRLAVTHETSSSTAEAQISSWLKSFEDVEFVKKRNQLRDVVFVSNESADEALDDIMSSEMGADSAPEKVKLSIIDYSTYSETMGVNTEYELIVKPIGETKIEGNVDSYCDDARELFGETLAMPDAKPSAESIANAEAKSENDNEAEDIDASQSPLYGEMKSSASSDLQDTLSESETVGRHRLKEDTDDENVSKYVDEVKPSETETDESAVAEASVSTDDEDRRTEDEERQQAKFAELQRLVNEEAQRIRANDEAVADTDDSGFAESSQEQETETHSDFADSRSRSLDLTFDESDIPEFAESSEIESKTDLERSDRLTFALDSIMPHSARDVLASNVAFDEGRLSQLSPQSRMSLEMSINQANSLLDNSRVDAAAESESVTNDELRDEIFSAISHFSESSDDNVNAYADAYAEAVSFANAIQVASDEIVAEYNAREDAWVAKQIDALREIYRQNNPDRTGEAIDALIEKNTPKYAELEAAAEAVRPAAVAAVVRFLRKKNTKASDAASELTRFSETRNIALSQIENSFNTLQGIDANNGFAAPNKPEPSEDSSRNETSGEASESQSDEDDINLTPASKLGLADDALDAFDSPSNDDDEESNDEVDDKADDKADGVADDVSLSAPVSALAENEKEESDAKSDDESEFKSDDKSKDEAKPEDESEDKTDDENAEPGQSSPVSEESISSMSLDESLKNDDEGTGEVSDFDEEEAAELPQDFMDDDPNEVDSDEKKKPSKKVIAIATACAVGLFGAGTLFTGFVWPGFFKSDETSVSTEESMDLPPTDADAADNEEQEPSDASGLYRMGDTIRVVVRGGIQNLTISDFTPGGGAIAENSSGDKFRVTQTQLDHYAEENAEQFEGRETLADQAPAELEDKQVGNHGDQPAGEENAPEGEPAADDAGAEDGAPVNEGEGEPVGDAPQ